MTFVVLALVACERSEMPEERAAADVEAPLLLSASGAESVTSPGDSLLVSPGPVAHTVRPLSVSRDQSPGGGWRIEPVARSATAPEG